jgi:hypothetical protein
MSIPFRCDCGKQLAAKDEFAGKRLKCPACGKLLTIPRPRAAATPIRPPASTQARMKLARTQQAPVGFIRFVCRCGRKLKARLADAGLEIDCPACGREMNIPETNGVVEAPRANDVAPPRPIPKKPVPPPLTARAAPAKPAPETTKTKPLAMPAAPPTNRNLMETEDPKTSHPAPAPLTTRRPVTAGSVAVLGDGLGSQRSAPWRDPGLRGRSDKMPREPKVRSRWRGAVLALLVIGLIGLEWYLVRQGPPSRSPTPVSIEEANLIPPDAVTLVTFRVADVANDKSRPTDGVVKVIRQMLKEREIKWPPEGNLDRVTLVMMQPPPAPKSLTPPPPPEGGKGPKGPPKGDGKGPKGKQEGPPAEGAKGQPKDPKGQPKDPKGQPKTPAYANSEVTMLHARELFKEPPLLDTLETKKPTRVRINKLAYSHSDDKAVYIPNDHLVVRGDKPSIDHFVREPKEIKSDFLAHALQVAATHDLVIAVDFTHAMTVKSEDDALKKFVSALIVVDDSPDRAGKAKMSVQLNYAGTKGAEAALERLGKLELQLPADAASVSGRDLVVEMPVNDETLEFLKKNVMFIHADTKLKSR